MSAVRRLLVGTTNPTRFDLAAIARQFVLIALCFGAYLGVRSLVDGSEAIAVRHARNLLRFEAAIGVDIEHAAQTAVLDNPAVIAFFNFVYAWTYWPYIVGSFVVTWFWRRDVFTLYRNSMMLSGAVGLMLFTLVPVAPPRFLDGFVDTVSRSARSNFIGHPDGFINEFAALPSFHVGWVAMASLVLACGTRRRWLRAVLAVPPIVMAIAVVLTANHYVIDVVVGVALSVATVIVLRRRSRIQTDTAAVFAA